MSVSVLCSAIRRNRNTMNESTIELGQRIKPEMDLVLASLIVENYFKLSVITIKEMDGYDDRNFHIEARTKDSPDCQVFSFTLKVTNSLDSSNGDLIEALNCVINFVHQASFTEVPYPIENIHGQTVVREFLNKQLNAIRLHRFVSGKVLKHFDYTVKLLYQAGQVAAKLDLLLENFHNLTLETRKTIWSLSNAGNLEKFMFAIQDQPMRSLVQRVMDEFRAKVLPVIPRLKTQIIHGDLNEQNIIVREENGEASIVGVIDFGDVHKAPVIFDLAILCCYLTLDSQRINPIHVPKYVIDGYKSVKDITEDEWRVLPCSIMSRLAQSLVLGAYTSTLDPVNAEYLLSTAKKGWQVLETFAIHGSDKLMSNWRS